jgi:hypothetical protein
VDVVRKIVKGDDLDFAESQSKPDKKAAAKKADARAGDDALVTEGWLEALAYFELRSRLSLNIQRTDGPVCERVFLLFCFVMVVAELCVMLLFHLTPRYS